MGALNDWDVTDANNNAAPPDGWPENTMAYSDVNDTGRAVQGTMKRFFADINGSLVGAGAADAYTVTLNESYAAYFTGLLFSCSIPAANTLTNPTIDVNGIGAVTIVNAAGGALAPGELAAGGVYDFRYDGTNMRLGGGGSGSVAAGSDTQLQYNNGGLLGGMSGPAWNDADDTLGWTASNTTETLMELSNASSLTTGRLLRLYQNNALFNSAGAMLEVVQDNAGIASAPAVLIDADSGTALRIDSQIGTALDINSVNSGGSIVQIEHAGSNGNAVFVDAAGANITGIRSTSNIASRAQPLVELEIINGTGSGDLMEIINAQSGYAMQVTAQAGSAAMDVLAGTVKLRAFDEFRQDFTGGSGTKNLDTELGTIFRASSALSGAVTFTFDNPSGNGFANTITLFLNDADAATITWPASVQWPGGTEPIWSAGIDIVTFVTHDGGAIWYGFLGGLDFS